mmetsp:Transcript_42894/g.91203  ORF Transcript_42894/g.91203 Transcript_42894/m.91203 type:complete len:244 (+) Transcript_42894:664-1395(+)
MVNQAMDVPSRKHVRPVIGRWPPLVTVLFRIFVISACSVDVFRFRTALLSAQNQRGHFRVRISGLDIDLGGEVDIGDLFTGRAPQVIVPRARIDLEIFGVDSQPRNAGIVGVRHGWALHGGRRPVGVEVTDMKIFVREFDGRANDLLRLLRVSVAVGIIIAVGIIEMQTARRSGRRVGLRRRARCEFFRMHHYYGLDAFVFNLVAMLPLPAVASVWDSEPLVGAAPEPTIVDIVRSPIVSDGR